MTSSVLWALIAKIMLMVGLGILLRKKGVIDETLNSGLSNLLIKAILPISIMNSADHTFSKALSFNLLKVAIIAASYYIITIGLMTLLSKKLHLKEQARRVFITMAVFANVGFIGFPIVGELYGDEGTLYVVIYNLCYQCFFFTYGVSLLSGAKTMRIKSLLKTPVTIASLIAIALFISPFRLPSLLQETMSSIGSMMTPVSMMIIGVSIAELPIKTLLKDSYSYIVSGLRLLILPLVLYVVLISLGLDHTVMASCILLTALPAGSLNVIYAKAYNSAPQFAARTVVQSMALMIITLPIIVLLIG